MSTCGNDTNAPSSRSTRGVAEMGDDTSEYGTASITAGLGAPYVVEFHATLGSSNDRALELAASGAPETVVVADRQTAPRGRDGREWESPPGGVWFSLLTYPQGPPAEVPAHTLAMAVAVCEACRETGVAARIKWPNDVLVGADGERGGRKLAGILTESRTAKRGLEWLVIGVGLNANVDPAQLPADADATSLQGQLGRDVDRSVVVQRILERYDSLRGDLKNVIPLWREYADTLGRRVRIDTPTDTVVGEAVDIEFPGTLVLRTDTGPARVTAGDCDHLRPL